jgi:putative drug exporter of the RND superfamily
MVLSELPIIRPSKFAALGALVYGYRKIVVLVWVAIVLLSLALIPQLEKNLQGTGMFYAGGQAHQAEERLQRELKIDPNTLTIVFKTAEPLSLQIAEQNRLAIEETIQNIRKISAVRSIVTAAENPEYRSTDGKTQYLTFSLSGSHNGQPSVRGALPQGNQELPAVLEMLKSSLPQNKTLKSYLTGKPAVEEAVQNISKADLGQVELMALPFTLLALYWVFGSLLAASTPVVMGIMTVSVTLGLLYVVSLQLSVSIFALNITSMLGLGLGIDYSLLMVTRFREELAAGATVQAATIKTVDTAGRAVFFSGLTVCIGLVAMLLMPILLLRSLSMAGSLVVLVSVLAALTLMPALLGILGDRINWGRPQKAPRDYWAKIARQVIRYRVAAIALVLAIVIALTSPFLAIRFGLPDANILPKATGERTGVDILEKAFGVGVVSPILLVVHSKSDRPVLAQPNIATLYNFVQKLQKDPRIAKVNSLFNFDPRLGLPEYQQLYSNPAAANALTAQFSSKSTTLLQISSRTSSHDPQSQSLVRYLRQQSLPDLAIEVAGQTANGLDTIEIVYQRFPWVLLAIGIVTFLVLCFLLNSVVLPIKAILMNFLSIGASFGALVFIFQEGNFQALLGFTPVGYLDILLPVVLFCVLFGLSMDYEVFLLSRIQEEYASSGDNSASVITGLQQTGGAITSAALLMIIVTGAFAFTSIIFVKALGLGTAIAVFIDATLIRAVLVPATMHLMGKWNWWSPRWLPGARKDPQAHSNPDR